MGDHLELYEIGKHLGHRRVHIQGDLTPLYDVRPKFVYDVVDLGREGCEKTKEPLRQPIFEGVEIHPLGPTPHHDRMYS